jgi:hypothetical protein
VRGVGFWSEECFGVELGCSVLGEGAGWAQLTMDLDQWLEKVKGGNYLLEDELKQLCEHVSWRGGGRARVWWW